MKKIKTEEELKAVVESADLVVLKAGAPWCGPCRLLEKTIDEIESENIDSAEFVEVDVEDADEEFVENLRVRNIPVLIYYKNGEAVDRTTGLVTKNEILDKIKDYKEQ